MAYYMENMTVKEMREVMKNTSTVVVPIGLSEQHGYHLPLCTDTKYVTRPLQNIADRVNCVIAPPLNYCYSGGELPGTINVNPSIFSLFVCEICRSLFQMGFKNVVVAVAHAGSENVGTLKNELTMFLRLNPQFRDRNLVMLIPHSFISKQTLEKLHREGDERDWHAGQSETSVMMYWCPELVKMDQVEVDDEAILRMMRKDPDWYAKAEKNIDEERVIPWIHQREEIKVGVMGYPELADRKLGELLAKEMEDGMADYINMLEEKSRRQDKQQSLYERS